jgi:hypothetical protein
MFEKFAELEDPVEALLEGLSVGDGFRQGLHLMRNGI